MRGTLATALLLVSLSTPVLAQSSQAFDFVALGDMPYSLPDDIEKFDRLIGVVNASKPSFTLHVGDIKSGSTSCADEALKKAYDQLATFEGALVYTPGDNEWTDCHREKAGGFDPMERLAKVRQLAFPNPGKSLGKAPIDVETQAKAMPGFETYVENQRFEKNGVLFVLPHVVGSNNNFDAQNPKAAAEFFERDKANQAWLADSFKRAVDTNAKAIVITIQADLYATLDNEGKIPRGSGFLATLKSIADGAKAFGNRPVLLISGDNHVIQYQQLRGPDLKAIPGAFQLQLFGDDRVYAVRITVDPSKPGVFGFEPIIVPENGIL